MYHPYHRTSAPYGIPSKRLRKRLVGWKNGTRTLNQSLSEVMQNQSNLLITLDTQFKTPLTLTFLKSLQPSLGI